MAVPTLQLGKERRGFSKEAEWPRFDPSRQASKWGCFPRPLLCKQTQGLGGKGHSFSVVLLHGILWPLFLSPPTSTPRVQKSAELPPSDQDWELPTAAACTGLRCVFRRKARKSQTGFPGPQNPHSGYQWPGRHYLTPLTSSQSQELGASWGHLKPAPRCRGQGRTQERAGHPRLVAGGLNKQRNLLTRLVLGGRPQDEISTPTCQILKVYTEVLTGLNHIDTAQLVLAPHHYLKAMSLGQPLGVG